MCVFVTGATAVLVAEVEDERQNKEPSSYYEPKCAVTEKYNKKCVFQTRRGLFWCVVIEVRPFSTI